VFKAKESIPERINNLKTLPFMISPFGFVDGSTNSDLAGVPGYRFCAAGNG
jgi:hypothetical protein